MKRVLQNQASMFLLFLAMSIVLAPGSIQAAQGSQGSGVFSAPPSMSEVPPTLITYENIPRTWLAASEGVQLYKDSDCSKPHEKAEFLEEFYELWSDDDTVLLATAKDWKSRQGSPSGYAQRDELVASKRGEPGYFSLKTDSNVYRKAMVVHKWEDSSDVERAILRDSPGQDAMELNQVNLYEILFVYAEREKFYMGEMEKYYLVGNAPYFMSSVDTPRAMLRGWLRGKRVYPWDHRQAVEFNKTKPALDWRNLKNLPIKLYNSAENALKKSKPDVMFEEDMTVGAWGHSMQRYPVIDVTTSGPWEMGVIGDSYSGTRKIAASEEAQLQDKFEELKAGVTDIDVLLVLDASGSMDQFYPSIAQTIDAIQDAMPQEVSVRYAVSYYRDYTEEQYPESWSTYWRDFMPGKEFQKLFTKGGEEFINASGGASNPCVWCGIDEGVNSVQWRDDSTRVVILIGDMGNTEERRGAFDEETSSPSDPGEADARGYTLEKVVETLRKYRCALFTAQAYPLGRALEPRIAQFYLQAARLHAGLGSGFNEVHEAAGYDLGPSLRENLFTSSDQTQQVKGTEQQLQEGQSLDQAVEYVLSQADSKYQGGQWGAFIKDTVIAAAESKGIDVDLLMNARMQNFRFAWAEEKLDESPYPQFLTMVYMQLGQLQDLIAALRVVERTPMTPKNVDRIWTGIVNAMIGESEDSLTYDENVPLSTFFTKSLGLPVRSEYLNYSIRELKSLDPSQISEWNESIKTTVQGLSNYAMNTSVDGTRKETHVYEKNGIEYLWVPIELFP